MLLIVEEQDFQISDVSTGQISIALDAGSRMSNQRTAGHDREDFARNNQRAPGLVSRS